MPAVITSDGLHTYLFNADTGGYWQCPNAYVTVALSRGWAYAAATDGAAGPAIPAATIAGTRTSLGSRWAAMGDSIVQSSWLNGANAYQGSCWPLYAALISGQRLNLVYNCGVSGETSSNQIARFDAEITPVAPSFVTWAVGTNDGSDAAALSLYQANTRSFVAKCRAINAAPVLCTITPKATTHQKINTWNAWLRRYAAANNLHLVDFYSAMVDPATGNMLTTLNSGDGTHPNTAGYLVMANLVVAALTPFLALNQPYVSTENADANNLWSTTNSILTTDANSDGVADSWFAYGGSNPALYAHALVTDAAVPGKMMQVTQSANDSPRILQRSFTPVVGNVIALSGVITSNGGVTAQARVTWTGASSVQSSPVMLVAAITRGVYYQEAVVPVGATSCVLDLIVNAGTGVVSWGRPTAIDLSAAGIVNVAA